MPTENPRGMLDREIFEALERAELAMSAYYVSDLPDSFRRSLENLRRCAREATEWGRRNVE